MNLFLKRLAVLFLAIAFLAPRPVYATDLSITAANVVPAAGYQYVDMTAGAAITAGQVIYKDSAAETAKLADCDGTAALAVVVGIALNNAASGQPVRVMTAGDLNIGATLTAGEIYVLSGTAGGVAPEGDLAQNDRVCLIGVATSSSNLRLDIFNSGATVP